MKKLVNLNLTATTTIVVLLLSCLFAPNAFAKKLFKSVNADGKITYSSHPPADSKTAQNVSALKGSPKFSIGGKAFKTSS